MGLSCLLLMATIRELPAGARERLRAGIAITTITQCIEELVLNSVDACATTVDVRVGFLE